MKPQALIIFTRIPEPNKTKTRLQSLLSPQQCSDLHYCFLKDIAAALNPCLYDVVVCYSGEPLFLLDSIFPSSMHRIPQKGDTLGERMKNAFLHCFNQGYKRMVLIGTDVPEIQAAVFAEAFDKLIASDVVIGLSRDGGYYLLGMKSIHEVFFTDQIPWGTEAVIAQSLEAAGAANLSLAYAETLSDIDTPEDLKILIQRISPQSFTGRYLQNLGRHYDL